MRFPSLFILLTSITQTGKAANALTSYTNDFVDPNFIVAGNFGDNTLAAQATILNWAQNSASSESWSVTSKNITPPSGSKHDYMSWAPYWWPDCSTVENTTELIPEEIWKTCPYVSCDGQFNPDGRLVNDIGNFQSLSEAILYNAIAFSLTGSSSNIYSKNTVLFIKTWFLDDDTKMNPRLEFAQMRRGPKGQIGSHTGILDLKGMTKIVSGIMILRKKNCTDWSPQLDKRMNAWVREYMVWLENAPIALEEGHAENNHGTFYYGQLAALKLLVGDVDGARNVTNSYFASQYMFQITASGEQPLEAVRTRPYHYHAYNLAAMIANARISFYAGDHTVWNKTTKEGATIKTALDFALTLSAAKTNETSYTLELYPSIAAVASIYGDSNGRYSSFLADVAPGYTKEANFLWNQPLKGGETASQTETSASSNTSSGNNNMKNQHSGAISSWLLAVLIMAGLRYGRLKSSFSSYSLLY